MRKLLLISLLLSNLALAQQPPAAPPPPAGSNWQRIHVIPINDTIYVKTATHKLRCDYLTSDDNTLTCSKSDKPVIFQRAEITSVQIGHRGRSVAFGTIPGDALAVTGIATIASSNHCKDNLGCGLIGVLEIAGGAVLAGVGAGVGASTDFARSTIYVAP